MKTITLLILSSMFLMSCSNDDGQEEKCDEIYIKYGRLIELASDDTVQRNTLIRNRDRDLEINGCL